MSTEGFYSSDTMLQDTKWWMRVILHLSKPRGRARVNPQPKLWTPRDREAPCWFISCNKWAALGVHSGEAVRVGRGHLPLISAAKLRRLSKRLLSTILSKATFCMIPAVAFCKSERSVIRRELEGTRGRSELGEHRGFSGFKMTL